MSVRDLMTAHPWVAFPEQSSLDAAAIMEDRNCGLVPVVRSQDDLTLLGVVTDRDLFLELCRKGLAPAGVLLGDCMTRNPVTCTPATPVQEAAAKMRRNRVRRLPVCDRDGRLVGVLSLADLARASAGEMDKAELAAVLEALSR